MRLSALVFIFLSIESSLAQLGGTRTMYISPNTRNVPQTQITQSWAGTTMNHAIGRTGALSIGERSPQIPEPPKSICAFEYVEDQGNCFPCPLNSFFTNDSIGWSNCKCRSGFSGHITNKDSVCEECGTNMFGYQGQCVACPAHSSTNGQTAQSMCECDISFFADGNQCVACPSNTTTARVGAQSIGHCVCVQRDHSLVFWNGEMQCRPQNISQPRILGLFQYMNNTVCVGTICHKLRSVRILVRFLHILAAAQWGLSQIMYDDFDAHTFVEMMSIAFSALFSTFELIRTVMYVPEGSTATNLPSTNDVPDREISLLPTTILSYVTTISYIWWKNSGYARGGNLIVTNDLSYSVVCRTEDCIPDRSPQVCLQNYFAESPECSVEEVQFVSFGSHRVASAKKNILGAFPSHLIRDLPFWAMTLASIATLLSPENARPKMISIVVVFSLVMGIFQSIIAGSPWPLIPVAMVLIGMAISLATGFQMQDKDPSVILTTVVLMSVMPTIFLLLVAKRAPMTLKMMGMGLFVVFAFVSAAFVTRPALNN